MKFGLKTDVRRAETAGPGWKSGAPVLVFITGLFLLAALSWSNRRGYWCPVQLPMRNGAISVMGEFLPETGVLYEVEIEVDQPEGPEDWRRLTPLTLLTNAPLDLRWEIQSGSATIVAGDAREAAYVSARTTGWRGRVRDALLLEAFHRSAASRRSFGLRGGGTVTRGLGHFRAESPSVHRIIVRPGNVATQFLPWNPALNVRRSRQEWLHHRREVTLLGAAAYLLLIVALVWGAARWRPRRRRAITLMGPRIPLE